MHRALCAARRTHVEHNTDSSLSITHPVSQASVPVLLQLAQNMFPEGTGAPKLTFKIDKAAAMTNELFVNARDAVRKLWEARGYDPYKPEITKQRLGYALDKEEALAYLVVRAMGLQPLFNEYGRVIGTRIGNALVPVDKKLRALRKMGARKAQERATLLGRTAALKLDPPPPRKRAKQEPPADPPLAAAPPDPPPPAHVPDVRFPPGHSLAAMSPEQVQAYLDRLAASIPSGALPLLHGGHVDVAAAAAIAWQIHAPAPVPEPQPEPEPECRLRGWELETHTEKYLIADELAKRNYSRRNRRCTASYPCDAPDHYLGPGMCHGWACYAHEIGACEHVIRVDPDLGPVIEKCGHAARDWLEYLHADRPAGPFGKLVSRPGSKRKWWSPVERAPYR